MSDERHETIDDIVEMLRANARGDRFDDFSFTSLADRIEAAHKREREAGAGCHQPVTDCHGLNAAAMREACADIAEYARLATCYTENSHLLGYLYQIEELAEAALSAPPRNCDVGTAEEQSEQNESEAAAKREREAGAEAAQICGEIGEIVGRDAACRKPVTDCHGLNAAAMREKAKPVRNCDKYKTAKGAFVAFEKMCQSNYCSLCPFSPVRSECMSCMLNWLYAEADK